MKKAIETRIENLVRPLVESAGLFLEAITVTSGREPLVRVTVDLPMGEGAVDADDLQKLTREISTALDEDDPIENAYRLEVSTPGAERELKTPRHFGRNIGRLVEIKTTEGKRIKGHITEATDDAVSVEITGKKGTSPKVVSVELGKIAKARSRVDFGSIGL